MSIEQPTNPNEENFKTVNGELYERVPSGYTVREYYSHETETMGPGPGWDHFISSKEDLAKKYGLPTDWRSLLHLKPSDLPDTPHYIWQRIIKE